MKNRQIKMLFFTLGLTANKTAELYMRCIIQQQQLNILF